MIYRNKKESVALSFAKMQSAMLLEGGMPTVVRYDASFQVAISDLSHLLTDRKLK
ncbi:MAG: hypothetical protein KBF99_18450 [Leptospiraceae bacterium]|nr:hypothetical protein [Leptospiraceae bacterium]MBK7054449.1 hypothetical protein [Leptospiraceae bacterium]MBK9498818.1 hypothetical protein [Leptospiraceae bacterium]MBL0262691.1 hypothetical protein [Leptospiraceae bacterium]MBP9165168.1 hypothetical protein [Leptospiraceae bacterium]